MLTFVLCVLGLWCLYNTIAIKLNKREDLKGDVLDKMTVQVLQIHCNRLNKIERWIKDMEDDVDD